MANRRWRISVQSLEKLAELSYTRVTDWLVKLGAEALVVPTMDVADWGQAQHELHGRIAPARAADYGLPIFGLASSGIS